MRLDRRSLLATGVLGLGAFALPGFARAQSVAALTGFTHAVASGEPGPHAMLLWTRWVGAGDSATLRAEMSETADFARVSGGAQVTTGPWRDWTAKATVAGLKPGTRYFYRFIAPDGTISPVGRTRTLPLGPVARFGVGVFSCSNLPFGFFNAYGHAALRDDLDLVVHLGDYLYEYARGGYAPAGGAVAGRWPEPVGELLHLADYRLRYASYRRDPDLMALHQAKPMIASMDDHESANDSWEGGAQNHSPDSEGDWGARKAAAFQAWYEWMPVAETPWSEYQIGTLATLFRTETRLLARTHQPSLAALFRSANPVAALKDFRDGAWQDPAMTMLGTTQEAWLAEGMARSVRQGTRWQVVGFGTLLGRTMPPPQALDWLRPDAPDRSRDFIRNGITLAGLGMPGNMDSWGGYPAARARFLGAAQAAGANLVAIAGDSHNGWAFDLPHEGRPAGVEFGGQGVTSPGYEASLGADPKVVAAGLVAASPELKWCDTSRRGYMALTLAPDRVRNDWVFMDTVLERSLGASIGHTAVVQRGRNVIA